MNPAILLVSGFVLIVYCYIGYPIVLAILARKRKPDFGFQNRGTGWTPSVAMIVPAHNEAQIIEDKLENVSETKYEGPFECIVVSDSNDETDRRIREHGGESVKLISLEERRGKSYAVNLAASRTDADVLVISDANTMYERGAVSKLVTPLAESSVGCTTGHLRYRNASSENGESTYWRYELWLRKLESRLGTTVSINGGLLAIRSEDFNPLPEQAFTDDFVLAMRQAVEERRIVYVPDAVGTESASGGLAEEFARRVRIGVGNIQALIWFRGLLNPSRGYIALQFFSHKVLRWLMPWILLAVTILSIVIAILTGHIGYWVLVSGEAFAYSIAGLGVLSRRARSQPIIRAVTYFAVMNAALAWGLIKFVSGPSIEIWKHTRQ